LVDCDRERYRSEPCLVGPVTIWGRAYDCIAVECTKLEKQTIHVGEVIGLVLQEARRWLRLGGLGLFGSGAACQFKVPRNLNRQQR
jgi:hypothetical protein